MNEVYFYIQCEVGIWLAMSLLALTLKTAAPVNGAEKVVGEIIDEVGNELRIEGQKSNKKNSLILRLMASREQLTLTMVLRRWSE